MVQALERLPDVRGRSRVLRPGRRRLVQGLSVAAFFGLWHLAAVWGRFPSYLLPPPGAVLGALGKELASGRLLVLLGASLTHYGLGVGLGATAGIAVGLLLGRSPRLELAVEPVLRLLRPIPPLAWIPLAIVWFGISQAAAAFIIAIVAFWINYYNSYSGVKGVDKGLLEAARSLGVRSSWRLVRKVVLPGAAPAILTGLRTSLGQGWMAVVASELFGVRGLGLQMMEASGYLAMDVVLAYMLVLGLLFSLTDGVFRKLERWVLRWRA